MAMTLKLRRSGVLAIVSAAAFGVITALYRSGTMRGLDQQVAVWLRGVHAGWLDGLAAADDVLFRPTPTFVAAVAAAVLLWRFGPRWSWCGPLAITVAALAEVIVKNGVSQVLHLRSFIDGALVLFGGHYHAAASFPSGHVIRAAFLAVVALAFMPRFVSVPFALLATTTLLARMYSEAHRLSDVLGGAALGIAIGCATVWAVGTIAELERARRQRSSRPSARFAGKLGAWR